MPAETIERQWHVLRAIPPAPRRTTVPELLTYLQSTGAGTDALKGLTRRTLERDITTLEAVFAKAIDVDRRAKPYGISWVGTGHPDSRYRLSDAQAVAFVLLEMHGGETLPPTLHKALLSFFKEAKGVLAQTGASPVSRWPDAVRVLDLRRPGRPPHVVAAILQAVCEALFRGCTLTAHYRGVGQDASSEQLLHPLGLVRSDGAYYLVATAWDYRDPRHYALHRMTQAALNASQAYRPDDFDLDAYVASGAFHIPVATDPVQLTLRVSPVAALYLTEAPLAADQVMRDEAEASIVTATVTDSFALRTWILSQGADIEVMAPVRLRRWAREALRTALSPYEKRSRRRQPP